MREILFRGKRKDSDEWVYGGITQTENWSAITFVNDYAGSIYEPPSCEVDDFDVIPETVGQYTGVTDKNGKKIFEGDIVKAYSATGELDFKKAVIYWDELFSQWKANKMALFGSNICATYEVIGNIHDNLELLKGELANDR